jgi:hypothetical protein
MTEEEKEVMIYKSVETGALPGDPEANSAGEGQ